MCELVVDVQVEAGSVAGNTDDWVVVTCETGRVVLAASAFVATSANSGVNKWPIAVVLADGALTNEAKLEMAGAGVGHGASTLHYYLTTGRVVEL